MQTDVANAKNLLRHLESKKSCLSCLLHTAMCFAFLTLIVMVLGLVAAFMMKTGKQTIPDGRGGPGTEIDVTPGMKTGAIIYMSIATLFTLAYLKVLGGLWGAIQEKDEEAIDCYCIYYIILYLLGMTSTILKFYSIQNKVKPSTKTNFMIQVAVDVLIQILFLCYVHSYCGAIKTYNKLGGDKSEIMVSVYKPTYVAW